MSSALAIDVSIATSASDPGCVAGVRLGAVAPSWPATAATSATVAFMASARDDTAPAPAMAAAVVVGSCPGTSHCPNTSNSFGVRAAWRLSSFSARTSASKAAYGLVVDVGSALGSSQPKVPAFCTRKANSVSVGFRAVKSAAPRPKVVKSSTNVVSLA